MTVTLHLDPDLLARAEKEAARQGITLDQLIERSLQTVLNTTKPDVRRLDLPVSSATGGALPGVELSNTVELLGRMDGLD